MSNGANPLLSVRGVTVRFDGKTWQLFGKVYGR